MLLAYRALLPGIALLCSLVTFILALCCLLAGTNPATLPNMQLYTLNTSKVGASLIRQLHLPESSGPLNLSSLVPRADLDSVLSSAEDSLSDAGDNLADAAGAFAKDPKAALAGIKDNITHSVDAAKKEVSDAIDKAEGAVKNATGKIVSAMINETLTSFHIRDFYVAHLLTWCEGNYTKTGEKLTYCSNGKPGNKYAATNSTKNGTMSAKADVTDPLAFIETLHLPDPVEYGFKALTLLAKIISAFYIVGIIAVFFALVSAAMTIPAYFAPPTAMIGGGGKRGIFRWVTLAMSGCAFFALFLASAAVHFLVKKLVGLVHDHPGSGVAAYPGKTFMGVSWAAVILVGIAMTLALVDVAVSLAAGKARSKAEGRVGRKWFGRKHRREEQEEKYDDEYEMGNDRI